VEWMSLPHYTYSHLNIPLSFYIPPFLYAYPIQMYYAYSHYTQSNLFDSWGRFPLTNYLLSFYFSSYSHMSSSFANQYYFFLNADGNLEIITTLLLTIIWKMFRFLSSCPPNFFPTSPSPTLSALSTLQEVWAVL
jgi:hypothetical protein